MKKSLPVLHFYPYLVLQAGWIVFIRIFTVALTVAALWWSSSSFGLGLGLGELNVKSSLASPLKATVTLRGMDGIDLDPEFFSIRIDSDSKSKVEYRLQRMDADTAVIDLYTREIISEPLFQFRIEVKWNTSAVARSYDVLVDPPAYREFYRADEIRVADVADGPDTAQASEQNEPQVQPPIVRGDVLPVAVAAPENTVTERPADEAAANAGDSNAIELRREYGPTINGNSIWRVARAVATDNRELTIYQWMYAIWNANPRAFSRDNMHRLNLGEVLSVPFEDEVATNTHRVAWRAYSEQMAMLQKSLPARNATTEHAPVETEQHNVPQQPVAHEIEEQPAGQNITTEVVPVEEKRLVVAPELGDLAASGTITVSSNSAPAIGEEAVSARGNDPVVTATQDAVLIAPVTKVEAQQAVDVGNPVDTPVAEDSRTAEAAMPVGQAIAGPVIQNSLDAVIASNQPSTNIVQQEMAADNSAMPVSTSDTEIRGWSAALLSRHEFIDQLPVIGGGGVLAFVGRAAQRVDRFVATSPSWAAMAFGAWVMLVLMMLRQEVLAWRTKARATKLAPAEATQAPVVINATARKPAAVQRTAEVAPNSAIEASLESVSKERHESASEARPESSPPLRPASSNAPEIVAHATSIMSQGDIEEAIKIMRLAVELQPHQPSLVMLLLELYHKTQRAVFFAELFDRSRSVLETLQASDLFRLRTMHAQLCPDLPFALGQDELAENIELPGEDSFEWSAVADPGLDLDYQPQLDTVDQVEVSAPDVNSEFSSEIQHDDKPGLDDAANTSGDEFDYSPINDDPDNEAYISTQVIFTNKVVPQSEEAMSIPGMVGENIDLDVILKEADVYLAYGLYGNAEELLLKGMEVDPDRADFLARLLDCYYAMRDIVAFVSCAEVMLDMGDAGSEYWEKIEIMGFELAPYNKMFAGGKDGKLSTIELEIARPETADFDFSDIAENNPAACNDIEIEARREVAFTDIEIDETGDNSAPTDLNLDQEANKPFDSADTDLDNLMIELDQIQDSKVADITDSKGESAIVFEALDDDLDAVIGESLKESEDDPGTVLVAEIRDEDDEEEINLDCDEEDAMQFTMDDDTEFGQKKAPTGDESSLVLVEESTLDSLNSVKLDSDNSRILYFPDGPSEGKDIDDFESEVKMTLQATRDQLQNMTERLFRQERATNDLQQILTELKGDSNASASKQRKKSS